MIENLVPVYVPRERLAEVYALLGTGVPRGEEQTELAAEPGNDEEWPTALLRRVVKESPPGMRVIFEALADSPDEWLSADDLAAALRKRLPAHGGPKKEKADWNTVAGTLGAFGRRFKNRYSREYPHWPFKLKNDYERDRWLYSMPRAIAVHVLVFLEEQ